jgi:hypothetical protein
MLQWHMARRENLGQIILNFLKIVGCLIGLVVGGFILMFWAALTWIACKPLPPLPPANPRYTIKELGVIPESFVNRWSVTWRLTKEGTVKEEEATEQDMRRSHVTLKATNGSVLEKGGYRKPSDKDYQRSKGKYIFRSAIGAEQLFPARQVEGYQWSPFCDFDFLRLNNAGEAVGATWMATGCASSGGTSSPHGRHLPLYWKPGLAKAIDLNTQIDPKNGWYLFTAYDINDQGQILCIGAKTEIRGAEHWQGERRFILLSPQKEKNSE